MSQFTFEQVAEMVAKIQELKDCGFTYREIDAALQLPRRSYLIMNGARAKFVVAVNS